MPQSRIPPQVPSLQPGDPREAPAPTARQTASEEPSGGGHGEETPETSSRLLFLTCLFGRHNNGQLCRGWMGTGGSSAQRGTARHTGAAGNPRGPARTAQPRPTPSIFQLHPAAVQWMLSPKNLPPPACAHMALSCKTPPGIPNTAGKTPARRRPRSWHGQDPAPGTVTGYHLHSVIWGQREQDVQERAGPVDRTLSLLPQPYPAGKAAVGCAEAIRTGTGSRAKHKDASQVVHTHNRGRFGLKHHRTLTPPQPRFSFWAPPRCPAAGQKLSASLVNPPLPRGCAGPAQATSSGSSY